MTKGELFKLLEDCPDDTPIYIFDQLKNAEFATEEGSVEGIYEPEVQVFDDEDLTEESKERLVIALTFRNEDYEDDIDLLTDIPINEN